MQLVVVGTERVPAFCSVQPAGGRAYAHVALRTSPDRASRSAVAQSAAKCRTAARHADAFSCAMCSVKRQGIRSDGARSQWVFAHARRGTSQARERACARALRCGRRRRRRLRWHLRAGLDHAPDGPNGRFLSRCRLPKMAGQNRKSGRRAACFASRWRSLLNRPLFPDPVSTRRLAMAQIKRDMNRLHMQVALSITDGLCRRFLRQKTCASSSLETEAFLLRFARHLPWAAMTRNPPCFRPPVHV
jgi:hypothetical protein